MDGRRRWRQKGWNGLVPMDAVTLGDDATPPLKPGASQHLGFPTGDDPPSYALHLAKEEYVGKVKEGSRKVLVFLREGGCHGWDSAVVSGIGGR